MTPQEERLIVDLHSRWGNRWSLIAQSLPGRTDNGIKNYWKTRLRKKFQLQENVESSVHCASSTRSASVPSSSQKAKEPCIIHITEPLYTAISSFHANLFPYMTNEFESEAQNAAAPDDVQFRAPLGREEYSTDLDNNFSREIFIAGLHRNNEVGYSLNNTPTPEAFSNTEFCSDELWNMEE
ncbi:hypothetical protein SUGI_0028010 [Cryptomeria japonica]|nr:hypothetical protein SUGI_0028010 [Cryptomeria japonica]